MHGTQAQDISGFLGFYYLILAVMNGLAALWLWQRWGKTALAMVWLLLGMVYMIMSPLAMSGGAPAMPEAIKHAINLALSGNIGAVTYTVGTTLGLLVLFLGRRFFVKPVVAWAGLNLTL